MQKTGFTRSRSAFDIAHQQRSPGSTLAARSQAIHTQVEERDLDNDDPLQFFPFVLGVRRGKVPFDDDAVGRFRGKDAEVERGVEGGGEEGAERDELLSTRDESVEVSIETG
jgi:hypothetical protein